MFKNEKGFTLIEMLIVLMIISVLIILIVPNLSDKGDEVYAKGCAALVSVVQAQVDAYKLEEDNTLPADLDTLVNAGYITEKQTTCPNNQPLQYDGETGIVSAPAGS